MKFAIINSIPVNKFWYGSNGSGEDERLFLPTFGTVIKRCLSKIRFVGKQILTFVVLSFLQFTIFFISFVPSPSDSNVIFLVARRQKQACRKLETKNGVLAVFAGC